MNCSIFFCTSYLLFYFYLYCFTAVVNSINVFVFPVIDYDGNDKTNVVLFCPDRQTRRLSHVCIPRNRLLYSLIWYRRNKSRPAFTNTWTCLFDVCLLWSLGGRASARTNGPTTRQTVLDNWQLLSNLFTSTHIKFLLYRLMPEDILSAITLRSVSPKAYNYFRNKNVSH